MTRTAAAHAPGTASNIDRFADLTEDALFIVLLLSGVVAAVAIVVLALAL